MTDFLKKLKGWQLLLLAAVLTAAIFAAGGIKGYMTETSAIKNGSLVTAQLQPEDFELVAFKPVDGGWRTTDTDPQMIYTVNGLFASIYMEMDSLLYTGDVVLYYTNPGDTAWSRQKRIFLVPDKDNPSCYRGSLPVQDVQAIRIDPGSVGGNLLNFGDIIINPPHTMADYFDISAYTLLMYRVYTLFIGAILRFVQEFFTKSFE